MNKVKVRAGQIWECNVGIGSYEPVDRLRIGDKSVHFNVCYAINFDRGANSIKASDKFLSENFTFIPQNSIEWMAVNLDEWYCASDYLRNGSGSPFICTEVHHDAVHINEWQNMRYYLGLDKKPHCKLIDGEWVKK